MDKHKKKQNGITLISLVISIIVMLILAGVTLNAAIGDNGIISQAQYATFLNEMAAVEEAVQLWKINQKESAIPANGLCQEATLSVASNKNAERLNGEVGYYRVWSMSETMPDTSIFASADEFNGKFEAEMIYFPAGVQDLYYLDNEGLGIDSKKEYIIDAVNSMVYSTTGITIKGVRVYSAAMAKAVMNGNIEAPLFAEAEVSGTGDGDKLAGNVQEEYLPDGTKNPDYNPYGFEIIADYTNNNVYKLYNNGDLYGKGIKGLLLNTSSVEMDEIDSSLWSEFNIPSEIPGYNDFSKIKIYVGHGTIYIIDSNGELWAWGDNAYNKLGLNQEEQVEYTSTKPVKLNVNNNKISHLFALNRNTFVITENNELYASGYNSNGQLGIGSVSNSTDQWHKVDFENPKSITAILGNYEYQQSIVIFSKDEADSKLYFAGRNMSGTYDAVSENNCVMKFVEICNGTLGTTFENNIKSIHYAYNDNKSIYVLDENNELFSLNVHTLQKNSISFNNEANDNIEKIRYGKQNILISRKNSQNELEYWCTWMAFDSNLFDNEMEIPNGTWINITEFIANDININEIKDFQIYQNSEIYFLMNDGKVYAKGNNLYFGNGKSTGNTDNKYECIQDVTDRLPLIEQFFIGENVSENSCFEGDLIFLIGKDGKYYSIGNQSILFREEKYQKNWEKIATNVKTFRACTYQSSLAYIDNNDDIWVLGTSAFNLGLNAESDFEVSNFVRLKDYLKGLDIYNNLDGKVEDYRIAEGGVLYIKTNSKDNNTLYCCGKFITEGAWYSYNYLGLEDNVDALIPTKLMENVVSLETCALNRFALVEKDSEYQLWGWGHNNYSSLGTSASRVPKQIQIDGVDLKNTLLHSAPDMGLIFDNNTQKMWITGMISESGVSVVNGMNRSFSVWTNIEMKEYFGNQDEIIKDVSICEPFGTTLFLTENGNLYGLGFRNLLGIGSQDTEKEKYIIALNNMTDVKSITAGSNFFVVTKNDGSVWATGNNGNGVLGRWIGIDRSSPNSRYKTAFEWVECPELEI